MQVLTTTELPREKYDFVKNEIAKWEEGNILSRHQSDQILARYAPVDGNQNGLVALTYAGCAIVGMAVFLFISSNWTGLDTNTKCFGFLFAMLACYLYAWHTRGKSKLLDLASEVLVTSGCMLFGAAIVTLAQTFQITGVRPELSVWMLCIAPIILIFKSRHATIMAALVCLVKTSPFDAGNFDPLYVSALLAVVACAYVTRSQIALSMCLIGLSMSCTFDSHKLDQLSLILFGLSCFVLHLRHLHMRNWQIFATPYLIVSMVFVFFGLLMLLVGRSSYVGVSENVALRVQIAMVLSIGTLSSLINTPAAKSYWPVLCGISMISTVVLFQFLPTLDGMANYLIALTILIANLTYLFYISSTNENRFVQFLPVMTLSLFSFGFLMSPNGGAMRGAGIALAVGFTLLAIAFSAFRKFEKQPPVSNLITTNEVI